MKATCIVCNGMFERGVGQSRSQYCSVECRRENRQSSGKITRTKAPKPYQKSDGNWYCTYQGRQYYLGNNPLKAEKKLNEILRGDHLPLKEGNMCLEDLIAQYLATIEHVQSSDTLKSKRSVYGQFGRFLGPNATLRSLTTDKLEKYKQHLFQQRLKKSTVRLQIVLLSALFDFLIKVKLLSRNPAKEIPTIKVNPDPDPDHLIPEEIHRLYELVRTQRYQPLVKRDELVILLMLNAGLRRIEVSNLKWSDVDFNRDLIILRTTKGEKPRIIGINKTLRDALEDCWNNWRLSDEYVVTNQSGGQLSREGVSHIGKKFVNQLNHHYQGRKRLAMHSLRATFATQLASKGVSTRVIQGLLGHADPRTTLRYVAYTEEMAVDAVRVLDP
ncbi:MAG: tyrosine-type recombinase/integrase [Planctomycetes bacterium]|nr:tyrosine-type recombinase/integrase [Planctomycetota bacterium]